MNSVASDTITRLGYSNLYSSKKTIEACTKKVMLTRYNLLIFMSKLQLR